jgi:hypothetical protein
MNPEKSLSRYILVILCVSVVFTALILVALNAYVTNKQLSNPNDETFLGTAFSTFSYEDGYKDGYNSARTKFAVMSPEQFSITGLVKNKTNNGFELLGENLYTDETVDGISDQRTILITTSTKIVKITSLSPEEFDAQATKSISTGIPPVPYTEQEISLLDIEEGFRVTVVSNEDVSYSETIEASKISFEE